MRWLFVIFIGLLFTSCEDDKDFSKDYATRKIIDSLFLKEIKILNETLTTQCSIRVDAKLDGLVDSILVIRRKEVEDILRRETLEYAQ